ncbi:hypothetical protein Tco_0692380 [Tanacetum coccineum]
MQICSKYMLNHFFLYFWYLDGVGVNTRILDSIWEETDEITTLHQFQYQKSIQWLEAVSQLLVTASGGSSDSVKILVTPSEVDNSEEAQRRIRGLTTLQFTSKAVAPSHEGYRNTIELPNGKNVVPLRSDTIRLVQNGCSFHGLWSEDPNQYLNDFLKLVDSLDLDVANKKKMRLHLFQFSLRDQASNWLERLPAGSIST